VKKSLPGFLLVLILLATGFHWFDRRSEGPVVVYLVDTLRPDRMSVYGASRETTPAAVELARESVLFENAFAVSTWTRPSVATLLTSLLPEETATWNRYGRLDETADWLPALLQKAGWRTAAFVGNGNIFDERLGFRRGFDNFLAIAGDNDNWKPPARQVVDPAVEFILRQTSPHFFIYVHVLDPHLPYLLEPSSRELFSSGASAPAVAREQLLLDYDRSIRQADDQFRRIAEALRHKSWWGPATVIYTADHGEEFYEHGGQGHGRTLYDEQVRVPLLIKFPAQKDAGRRRADLVSLADVTPTLAEIAGLPRSDRWIGRSLRRASSSAGRALYLTESLDDVRVSGLRTESRKLVVQLYPDFKRAVYDLARDPREQAGTPMPCGDGTALETQPLYRLFQSLHGRDVAATPGIQIEKVRRDASLLDLAVNLGDTTKPFLTAEDYCSFRSAIEGSGLRIRRNISANDPFELRIAADDRGNLPIVRIGEGASAFRLTHTTRRLIDGPTSDEMMRRLRALGYLGGDAKSPHRSN
jgi:arylsulfatase A-like enzyme